MHFWLQHCMALASKVQELFMQTICNMDREYLSKLMQLVGGEEFLEGRERSQLVDQSKHRLEANPRQ